MRNENIFLEEATIIESEKCRGTEKQMNLEVIAGRSECENEAEINSPVVKKRKLKEQEKLMDTSTLGKSGKGIGKKSNQNLLLNVNKDTYENFEMQEIELDSVNVTQMPIYFADTLECNGVIVESENEKNN